MRRGQTGWKSAAEGRTTGKAYSIMYVEAAGSPAGPYNDPYGPRPAKDEF